MSTMPETATDHTTASECGAAADTTLLGPPELAWSAADDVDEPPSSWHVACRHALLVFTVCLMTAGVITAGFDQWSTHSAASVARLPEAVLPTAAPTAAATGVATVEPAPTRTTLPFVPDANPLESPEKRASTQDDAYLAALAHVGVYPIDRAQAIGEGRRLCELLREGHSVDELAHVVAWTNPQLVRADGENVVHAAQASYCPEVSR